MPKSHCKAIYAEEARSVLNVLNQAKGFTLTPPLRPPRAYLPSRRVPFVGLRPCSMRDSKGLGKDPYGLFNSAFMFAR
jgi:hypothetical protein